MIPGSMHKNKLHFYRLLSDKMRFIEQFHLSISKIFKTKLNKSYARAGHRKVLNVAESLKST